MSKAPQAAAIVGAIAIGPKTYTAGMEDELAGVLTAEQLSHLQSREPAVLSGEWAIAGAEPELPTVAKLAAHLETLTDAAAVQAMADRDDRKSAAPLYEARLAALQG